jgi:hypothetical protein
MSGWHIDMLSSDHSPSIPHLKLMEEGNFLKAWGGLSIFFRNGVFPASASIDAHSRFIKKSLRCFTSVKQ